MKFFFWILLLSVHHCMVAQPPFIHSHNDYRQQDPLRNALRNKAFSIEADVYLVNDSLRVAHDKEELAEAPSLFKLYLQPIIDLFNAHHNRISDDSIYSPILMIDIKTNGKAVLDNLVKLLNHYPKVFDRSVNPHAAQVVISGDRGLINEWTLLPAYILFDGRPNEVYNGLTRKRVAFISDSYANYANPADSIDSRIRELAEKVHQSGYRLRLWGIPDNADSWKHLLQLGVDIINTDHVTDCRNYFYPVK